MPPPSEAPTPPRYSLWLMPPAPVYDRFARLIDALSRRFGTPRFAPHITLASTGAELAGDAPARAAALAAELAPVPVRLLDVAHTDDYFRSLFVRAQRTPALLAAHRLAAARLGTEPAEDFMPHLSLLYGELPRDTKERLIEEIGRRFDVDFTAAHLVLCLPAGAPQGWRTLGPFALTGGAPASD